MCDYKNNEKWKQCQLSAMVISTNKQTVFVFCFYAPSEPAKCSESEVAWLAWLAELLAGCVAGMSLHSARSNRSAPLVVANVTRLFHYPHVGMIFLSLYYMYVYLYNISLAMRQKLHYGANSSAWLIKNCDRPAAVSLAILAPREALISLS